MADPACSVLGVDGVKARWVAIELANGQLRSARLYDSLSELPLADVIAIDMFVALGTCGPRAADRWCRSQVGGLSSSVFNAPARKIVVDESITTYNDARRALEPGWPGMSIQTWGLVPKIRDVRAFVRCRDEPVFEAHPEVCFARLAGSPLRSRKKTWAGQRDRLAVLANAGLDLRDQELPEVAKCPVDDVVDAAVVAVTADLWVRGAAELFPSGATGVVLAPK